MQRTSLKDFVSQVGQIKAASLLGLTQGGISKAIRTGRDVYVMALPDGEFKAEEVKPFPAHAPKAAA